MTYKNVHKIAEKSKSQLKSNKTFTINFISKKNQKILI